MSIHIRLIVQDRHGVLDRISGLIRRNGWNISEINAGEKEEGTSCINIRMKDRGADIHTLGKALTNLECVKSWEECTDETHFTREILLFSVPLKDYHQGMIPHAQLIEQTDEMLYFTYVSLPSEIDTLLKEHTKIIRDYSRGGALGLRKEGGKTNE